MNQPSSHMHVISLGGSIVVPDLIDAAFLSSFKSMIEKRVEEGNRFVIIVGGGKPARLYQDGLKQIGITDNASLDWVGIAATRMNAELLRLAFGTLAHNTVIIDPTVSIITDKPILIGAGWKPGWSTDYVSVVLADALGAKHVANLSNIDFVYETDPRTNPDAKKFETLPWADYRALIPAVWTPGFSAPFDPVASAFADEHGIEVAIMNGKNLENLEHYLDGDTFTGTRIQ
jgi:uridylate kinase